jgi:CheY-like chemotaxis protein
MATPKKDQPGAAGAAGSLRGDEPWSLSEHAPALLVSAAEQIGDALQALQAGVDQLQSQQRLGPQAQLALGVPLNRIKRLTFVMQQLNRFHGGRIRQTHEKLDLSRLVEDALQERRKEFALLGVEMRRKLKPVDVLIDPTVAHAMLNALIDWALPLGRRIDVRVDLNHWPPHARLQVRVHGDGAPPSSAPGSLDNLDWALVRQIAVTASGVDVQREITAEGITITALFQRTAQSVDGISAIELSTTDDPSSMFKSLQSVYALVVSPALQIRADVRDALREIGVTADSVVDLQQASDAIAHRTPSLIVIDATLKGAGFDAFRRDVLRLTMDMPFVEISHDDSSFDMSGFGEMAMAKVGRGNIREALGTAVMFELAKTM